MSSITGTYTSPSKMNGIRPGAHLGLNGDASHDHTHSPDHALRNGAAVKEPFYRVDTVGLKKKLLDMIGEEEKATEYWGCLAQFLKGKSRRDEFEKLVKPVLDTHVKRQLHNQLMTAIMYNATSTLPIAMTPTLPSDPYQTAPPAHQTTSPYSPNNPLKRPLDADEIADVIQPKNRVRQWVLALPRSERKRIKDLQDIDGRYGSKDWCEMSRGWQGRGRVRSTDTLAQTEALRHTGSPLCMSTRAMPPVADLNSRIRNMANLYGLQEGVADELGSFMSIALEYHMTDLISSAIELKRHREEERDAEQLVVPMEVDAKVDAKDAQAHQSPDNVSDSLRPEGDSSQDAKDVVEQDPMETAEKANPAGDEPKALEITGDVKIDPPAAKATKTPETLRLTLADLEDFFTVAPHVHPHQGSATYRLRNGLARAVEEQEILAEQLMKQRYAETDEELEEQAGFTLAQIPSASNASPMVPSSSVPNSQPPTPATRSATPLSIFRKGAPSLLPNIPRIEINATPANGVPGAAVPAQAVPPSPNTPRAPTIGEGGIVLSRSTRSTALATNPTEAFRAKMEARGILKSMDRAAGAHGGVANAHSTSAGQSVSGDGYDVAERQLHVHHWNYVDPAVIFKDILG